MLAVAADLLRLLFVPAFAWAAYRDVRTRRLPNRLWPPLLVVGVIALALDAVARFPFTGVADRLFLVQVGFSVLFLVPFAYLSFRLGAFGGADAKALMTLAVGFPTTPTYETPVGLLPAEPGLLGVTAMAALVNAVTLAAVYVVGLAAVNASRGRLELAAFLGRPTPVARLATAHGRLLSRDGLPSSGLDLDALRMYLRWRGLSLDELRADPDRYRDPRSVERTFDPTDGAVGAAPAVADGSGTTDAASVAEADTADDVSETGRADANTVETAETDRADANTVETAETDDDPWAAAAFLAGIDGTAYGTTPTELRRGIERITSRETVWVSPGLPFVVPLFGGLVVAITVGDVFTLVVRAVGVV